MKPLDPRLMRYARSARRYIAATAVAGMVTAALVVAQAFLVSGPVSSVISDGAGPASVRRLVVALGGVMAARALVVLLQELHAHRSATGTIIELRRLVLEHAARLGPRWQALHGAGTATLLTRGLDDLEPYFTRYLPQLVLAATVTPATVLVLITQDWPAAVAVVCTLPLIPIFMILIGRMTQSVSQERLEAMQVLGDQVLDLISGLPTLKALGREQGPAKKVRSLGRAYRRTTMSTLRIAFLSGAVLEFITTLSVAIIAVEVGFRLVAGRMDLFTGLLVLMVAPEVYQPLRQVGFQFHASANGVAAAEAVFEVLETPVPERGTLPAPDLRTATIELDAISVAARGTWAPADLSTTIRPGSLVALTGPSGAGKTTTTQVLLGLLPADRGQVRVVPGPGTASQEAVNLGEIAPATWWEQIAWVPQRPTITPGTVLSNVLVDAPNGSAAGGVPDELEEAARATGFDEVVADLPQGWETVVGSGGVGLSVGQRQRLALTRALCSTAPLVFMDEPTAHLDAASEAHVLASVRALHASGRTVVVIAHRPTLIALAEQTIAVTSEPMQPAQQAHASPDQSSVHDLPMSQEEAQ
ncbi:thiol reductant ABC exporter subunit CydD [Actinomyces sp. Marseille-P3109]|uniref:thiol reductant ABC exporter subunit CydD n=1 Tax=Actinomyces sp. Marseille-P3109 TaxID=2083009 RepID=UPI0019010D26|nr:thiol reductant ABC exporter subunit CydD [Actinomyces sp. Marseille-P3109]